MAGGKETPRQKMIGMMYLVLTALLALNVSKSILEAFVRMNSSIRTTNENFMQANEKLYAEFASAKANNPEKVGPYYNKAMEVKKMADGVYNYIDSLKGYIMKAVDGVPRDSLENLGGLDNYDIPSNKLGLSTPATPKEGPMTAVELEKRIDEFRQFIKTTVHNITDGRIDTTGRNFNLSTKGNSDAHDPAAKTWGGLNFYHAPAAAVITTFSKLQSDIRNAESDIVDLLFSQVSAQDFKFDTLAAKVIPNSNYLAVGDTYRAEVLVAALRTTKDPRLKIGEVDDSGKVVSSFDTSKISFKDGMGYYSHVVDKKGEYKWGGEIQIQGPGGEWRSYELPATSYRAAKQNAVVSPTKMNVFYRGVKNPISVSVPGVAAADLSVSISNARRLPKSGDGNFFVKPGNGRKSIVTVKNKKTGKSYGKKEFRVQRVPDPKPYFLGKSIGDDKIKAARVKLAPGVEARMENFQFDLSYKVVKFTLGMTVAGQFRELKTNGQRLSGDMKELLNVAKPGQTLFIQDIIARGPDGTRPLADLSFKLY